VHNLWPQTRRNKKIVLIPTYAVPRAFLVHSYSLIGLLRKASRHSAPADSLHYGIETAWT